LAQTVTVLFNISTIHLALLRTIHDFQWIAEVESAESNLGIHLMH